MALKAPPLVELKSGGSDLMWKTKAKGVFKRTLRTLKVMHTIKINIVFRRLADFLSKCIIARVLMVNSKVADTWEETAQAHRYQYGQRPLEYTMFRFYFTAGTLNSSQRLNVQLQNSVTQSPFIHSMYRKKIKKKKNSNRENTISIYRPVKDLQYGLGWEPSPSVQETLAIWWRKGLSKGSPCDMVGDSSSPSTSTWLSRDLNTSPLMGSHHTG